MASKRETVLAAVKALVAAALPGAEVKRNLAKAERIPPGGLVVIRDGEPDRFQDFVIAHELLHLRVPNHGRLFKALMTAHVPGWRSLEVSRPNRAAL